MRIADNLNDLLAVLRRICVERNLSIVIDEINADQLNRMFSELAGVYNAFSDDMSDDEILDVASRLYWEVIDSA